MQASLSREHPLPPQEALTLVLGASPNPRRASHAAVEQLVQEGRPVYAVGIRPGTIAGQPIHLAFPDELPIDTITLYLNARRQEAYAEAILKARPRRLIFNPGAENPTLAQQARQAGIRAENACTLVLIATGAY